MEPRWLDKPFFDLIEQFASIQGYFLTQAVFIAQIVMTINLGFIALKYAVKGSDLKEPLVKLASSLIIFLIIINVYPKMITGMNEVIYEWSYQSTYSEVSKMIQKTTEAGEMTEFWEKKADPNSDSYSDIIKVLKTEEGGGNLGKKYVLDIFDKGSDKRPGMYIRPNAIMRVLMLTFEQIWNKALTCLESTLYGVWIPKDPGGFFFLFITAFAVIICGILASLQYFICALEFTLITSVGCVLLAFMLWDSSKFLTEKFVGAIVGFAVKMLFVTLCMMLAINGYLALMVKPFDSFIDQGIYTIFVSLFYMMICQNGPALAVSLLTGSPQMSLMEGVQAVGAYGAAAFGAGKAIQSGASAGVQAKTQLSSAHNKAKGAAEAAKEEGGDKKAQSAAYRESLGASAKDGVKSVAHGLGASLTRGKGSGGGGGSAGGNQVRKAEGEERKTTDGLNNRYSTMERRNAPNADGNRKTSKEFRDESKQAGKERYHTMQQEKQQKAAESAKREIAQRSQHTPGKPADKPTPHYDGGTPTGQGTEPQKPRHSGI